MMDHFEIQLELEMRKIARPFLKRIEDVYLHSTFSVMIRPPNQADFIYPPETEAQVEHIKSEMMKALRAHQKERQLARSLCRADVVKSP